MGRINSLRTKLILIMVLLILAIMLVVGAYLLTGVSNFYIGRFYDSMEKTFSQDFILSLQDTAERSSNPPQQLTEMLMAQSDLGIDMSSRNVYILDKSGAVLAGSGKETNLSMTENLLTALTGQVGQSSSSTADYMDLAVPIAVGEKDYVIYPDFGHEGLPESDDKIMSYMLEM